MSTVRCRLRMTPGEWTTMPTTEATFLRSLGLVLETTTDPNAAHANPAAPTVLDTTGVVVSRRRGHLGRRDAEQDRREVRLQLGRDRVQLRHRQALAGWDPERAVGVLAAERLEALAALRQLARWTTSPPRVRTNVPALAARGRPCRPGISCWPSAAAAPT